MHHVLQVRQALTQRHIGRKPVLCELLLDVIGAPLGRLSEPTVGISRPLETIGQVERFVETKIQFSQSRCSRSAASRNTKEVQTDPCQEKDRALLLVRNDSAPEQLADKAPP
jgi:hypothetical protein